MQNEDTETVREEGRFEPLAPDREIIAANLGIFLLFFSQISLPFGKKHDFKRFPVKSACSYHQGKMTNVFPVSVVPKYQYVAPVTFCAKVF